MAESDLFLTPNPGLALRADGSLVRVTQGREIVRRATSAEFKQAADLAWARGLEILAKTPEGQSTMFLPAIAAGIIGAAQAIGAIVGAVTAVITALELAGITESKYQPIFDKINVLNGVLRQILIAEEQTQDLVYATWASARWDDIAEMLGQSKRAIDLASEVERYNEDRSSPAVIDKLGRADEVSRAPIDALIAAGIDGGYWYRPHFPRILNMNAWSFKTDDRPEVLGDGRVWDYRMALPPLVAAIMARIIVLKIIYPAHLQASARICSEARTWNAFLSSLIQRIQANVRRKTDFTTSEKTNHCEGAQTTDFFAGAVDLTTGLEDFVNFDPYGQAAEDAYLRKTHQRVESLSAPYQRNAPGMQCYGGFISLADFSDYITWEDVTGVMGVAQRNAVLLDKQGRFAENRLLWQTPVLQLCDLCGKLLDYCPENIVFEQVRHEFGRKRALFVTVAEGGKAKKSARDAYALVDLVRSGDDSEEERLRDSARLTAVMLDEQAGPTFRDSLRRLVHSAVGDHGIEKSAS